MKKRVSQGDAADDGRKSPRLYLREVAAEDDGPYEGIGTDLRAARVEMGVDVAAVADNLRISRLYLEAIEDGRFEDLPGSAYVFGFLRSYAEFLDLEPKAVVAKYKSETEGPRAETKLDFPSPMDRGRLPTGRLLASSLVLAGLVYAGWYIVNGDQRQSADLVSPVPDRFRVADGAAGSTTQQVAAPIGAVTVEPVGRPSERLIRRTETAPAAVVAVTEGPPSLETQVAAVAQDVPRQETQVAAVTQDAPPQETQVAAVTQDAPRQETQSTATEATPPAPVRAEKQVAAAEPQRPAQQEQTRVAPAERSVPVAAARQSSEPVELVDEFAGLSAVEEPEPRRPRETEVTRRQTSAPPVRKREETTVVAAVESEPAPPLKAEPATQPQATAATPAATRVRSVPAFVAAEAKANAEAEEFKRQAAAAAETKAKAEAEAKAKADERRRREVAAAEAKAEAEAKAKTEAEERRRREAAAREQQVASRTTAATAQRNRSVQIEQAAAPVEVEPARREDESVQLAAARRISELTNDGNVASAANGAVRSFPVPPPIPRGERTASLSRSGEYVPQVFGASNGKSRVVIEAKLESWVQVRGRSGETLLTRILRVGDKYLVPDRPNLVMMTGNAGALKITVDGEEIGALGPPGAVLRDVSLEPSQLLARASSQ